MNYENVTIEDCIDMYEKKGKVAVINDGKILNFVPEE